MRRKVILAGFALAAALTVFFLIRILFFALSMGAEHGPHPVRPWMTPRYIGHRYDIPREDLQAILALQPFETPRQPLKVLARQRGISVDVLIAEIEAVIAARDLKRTAK